MNTAHRTQSHAKRQHADPGAWINVIAGNQEQPAWNVAAIMVKIRTSYELLKSGHASDAEVYQIREMHKNGCGYKQVNKHHPMSEKTFYNIVNKQGAYK